jgi:RNA polymerase sigma-70 factor (ECF subfamily)
MNRPAELIDLRRDTRSVPERGEERDDVVRAASGDVRAFERLYRTYVPRIHGLCRRMVGDTDADDAVQEVFVRTWRKRHPDRRDTAFASWLHRLADNVVQTRVAGQARKGGRAHTVDADVVPIAGRRDRADLRIDLESAIDTLPPGARQVFVLHDVEGYTHEEIGELLNVTPGTSKSQLHRARMALRQYLAG